MAKTKLKSKKLAKGVALGFATMLTTTAMPVGAVVALAEEWKEATLISNTNKIAVGETTSAPSYVTKGEKVSIPTGVYYGKSSVGHTIGSGVSGTITRSDVIVTYSATGDEVQVQEGKFTAERVGTYKITYAVVDNGVFYSYSIDIICEASEAEFEFASNSQNIIPSIYDVAYAGEKNITLPLPSVNDVDGEELLASDISNFTIATDGTPSIPTGKTSFVAISITNGGEDLQVKPVKDETDNTIGYAIKGSDITSALKGKEYTINYAYYEVKEGNPIFVASTTKSFTVRDGYYRKSSATNAEAGYSLVATISGKPDSAIVGVETTLPTITAKTKAENTPSNESIEVYYTLKVRTKDASGNYTVDVTDNVITKDGKFKADAQGDYSFEYIVKDFYGNTNEDSKASTTFTINNVKDTKAPEVFIYDAGTRTQEEKDNGTYRSAKTVIKTQTVNRNLVMYAIGGVDNMKSNKLIYRREILDASFITRYIIKEQLYNDYNLIFAPSKADGTDVYKQIVEDNYEIYRQMVVEGEKDPTDSDDIKIWLLENNYLLVTNEFNKDVDKNPIVAGLTEDATDAIEQMRDNGYAYIKPENASSYTFSGSTYTFNYYASDNINNNPEGKNYVDIVLQENFKDNVAPKITFQTELQSSYLPTDVISFKTITESNVSDSGVDTRPVVGTAYRFLKDSLSGRVAVVSDLTQDTLTYVAKGKTTSEHEEKYYYADRDASTGLFTSTGWHIDNEATSYKIDLSKSPKDAQFVEILAYAIDDYGNIGFYNKIVRIASTDTTAPELARVINVPSTTAYQAPDTITLPTLQFSDDKVEGMHARVDLYKISRNDEGAETSRQALSTTGMTTSYDSINGVYTVDAGVFKASSAGEYQVVVTVIDSANHTLSTYFSYNVNGATYVEEPEIANVSTETKELELGKSLYLPTPTLSVSESNAYGYIGLGDEDDSNNATYYFPQIVSATSSDYELDSHYFTGNTKGTYKLQYNVFLLRYNKNDSDFAETKTNNKLSLEGDKLVFTTGDRDYYVYIEKVGNEYQLRANTKSNRLGDDLTDYTRLNNIVSLFSLQSKIVTISVQDVVIKVTMPNNAYAKTDYPTLGGTLKIEKPNVEVLGSYQVNKKDSIVTISFSSNASTSRPIATISLEEWENAVSSDSQFVVDGRNISLKLTDHGQYKIEYSIQAQDVYGQNVGDPKKLPPYVIKSGDNIKPTFEFKSGKIITDYALGESFTLSFTGASVSNYFNLSDDKTQEVEELLKTLKLTMTGPNKTEEVRNISPSKDDGGYEYEYRFEEAGEYTLTLQIKDQAGNQSTEKISFVVKAKEAKTTDVKNVMGGVLIGLSLTLLAGVVVYFVVSKVKLDKKERAYKNK